MTHTGVNLHDFAGVEGRTFLSFFWFILKQTTLSDVDEKTEVTPLKLSFVTSYASILSVQLWHNSVHDDYQSALVFIANASNATTIQS